MALQFPSDVGVLNDLTSTLFSFLQERISLQFFLEQPAVGKVQLETEYLATTTSRLVQMQYPWRNNVFAGLEKMKGV